MTALSLLAGLLVAAGVFGACLWSGYQCVMAGGRLRLAHAALLALTLLGMTTLEAAAPGAARLSGIVLTLAALVGVALEVRWTRLLPLFQGAFGLALVLGLPFRGP